MIYAVYCLSSALKESFLQRIIFIICSYTKCNDNNIASLLWQMNQTVVVAVKNPVNMEWSQFDNIQKQKLLTLENLCFHGWAANVTEQTWLTVISFGLQQETNSGLPAQSQGRPPPLVTSHQMMLL